MKPSLMVSIQLWVDQGSLAEEEALVMARKAWVALGQDEKDLTIVLTRGQAGERSIVTARAKSKSNPPPPIDYGSGSRIKPVQPTTIEPG